MRKRSLATLSLITSALFLIFLGCGQDDIPNNPVPTYLEIVEHSPTSSENFVTVNAPITITFSEDINTSTLDDSVFVINPTIAGDVSYSNRQATFTPASNYEYKTVYSVTLRNLVRDVTGRYMEDNANWLFTTRSMYPEVVSVVPSRNQQNVPISSNISLTFSVDLDPTTISESDVVVFPATSGTVSYADKVITFTPDEPLEYGKTYNVRVDRNSIQDIAGLYMEANYNWTFTITNVYPDGLICPLKAGNYWTYERNYYTTAFDGSDTIKVDTARLNIRRSKLIEYMDEDYTVFYWNWYNVPSNSPNPYYDYVINTIDGLWWMGGVHYVGSTLTETFDKKLWFKYPVTLNDTWDLNDSVSLECTAIGQTFTTPVGDFSCHVYREMTTSSAPPAKLGKLSGLEGSYALLVTDYYIAPNVGLVGYKVWGDGELVYDATVYQYLVQ